MASYEPVDLSAACNAGTEVLGGEPGEVPLGKVNLRGLPFLIGPEPPAPQRCFLLPGRPVTAVIGRVARRVIIAHRLLDPGAPAGHAAGRPVAEYAFHLAGGEVVVAPIRERFEIQVVPPEWGRQPFLAVPRHQRRQPAAFRGPVGPGRGTPDGAHQGRTRRVLPVVLGEPSSGTAGRTDRVPPAGRPVRHRRRHDQQRR
jgi:hypothetical protein